MLGAAPGLDHLALPFDEVGLPLRQIGGSLLQGRLPLQGALILSLEFESAMVQSGRLALPERIRGGPSLAFRPFQQPLRLTARLTHHVVCGAPGLVEIAALPETSDHEPQHQRHGAGGDGDNCAVHRRAPLGHPGKNSAPSHMARRALRSAGSGAYPAAHFFR